jgi:hypothetical protein
LTASKLTRKKRKCLSLLILQKIAFIVIRNVEAGLGWRDQIIAFTYGALIFPLLWFLIWKRRNIVEFTVPDY